MPKRTFNDHAFDPMTCVRLDADRQALLDAATSAALAVPKKTPRPVLEHLLLVAGPTLPAELHATNGECGVRVRVPGLSAAKDVRVLLPKDRVLQILRTATDVPIAIDVRPDEEVAAEVAKQGNAPRVRLSGARWTYDLESPVASDFPDVPAFEADAYHAVVASDLKHAIDRTIFATDDQSTRYSFSGVMLECEGIRLTAVATDGCRLARQVMTADYVEGVIPDASMPIVPVRALRILDALVADDDPPVHVAASAHDVAFRFAGGTLSARLVEGRFPDWRKIIPDDVPAATLRARAGDLLTAFEQAEVATADDSRGVSCEFTPGVLRLKTIAPDVGHADVEMTGADVTGEARVRFDVRFVVEALRCLDPESEVTLRVVGAKTPAMLSTTDDYLHVLMPLTGEA